ncbi:MAG: hypothetical protein HFE99_11360, partial [Ruminiclostridium sp.]|nr:hypothetical protein [Ruminiclostridium sp.]
GPDGTLTSKVTVQDKVVGNTNDKITLLEDKYEAETAVGVFAGNSSTISTLDDGNIQIGETGNKATINGETLSDGTSTFDFKYDLDLKYIGEEIKVLYRDNKDGVNGKLDPKDTIYGVYITGTTTVYNITKGDLQTSTVGDGKIKFNDKEYKVSTAAVSTTAVAAVDINYGSAFKNVVTGGNDAGTNYSTYEKAFDSLKANSADTIKFIVKDGEIVKAYVQDSKYGKISSLTSSKIAVEGIGSKDLEDCTVYSGASVGDLVKVTEIYASSERVNVIEKANTVTGKITAFKDSDDQVQIDGNWYKHGANLATATDYTAGALTSGDVGDEVILLVDGNYYFAYDKVTNFNNYAIVTKGTSEFGDTRVQLLKSDGSKITAVLDDGTLGGGNTGAAANAELFAYDLKSDNTKVDLSSKDRVVTASYAAKYNGDNRTLEVASGNTLIVDADAAVFVYVDKWKAYTAKDLGSFTATSAAISYILDGDKIVAFAVTMANFPTGGSDSTGYGYVTNRIDTESGDDKIVALTVWTGETDVTVNVDGRSCDAYVGDFIEYPIVSNGALVNKSDIKVDGSTLTTVDTIKVKSSDGKVLIATTDTVAADGKVNSGVDTSYTLTSDTKYIGVNSGDQTGSSSKSLVAYTKAFGDDFNNAVVIYETKTSGGISYKEVKAVFIDEDNKLIHYTAGVEQAPTGPVTTYTVATPTAITGAQGLNATVAADKSYARNGDIITYTVTVSGTASAASKITITPGANSTVADVEASGEGWTKNDTSTAYVESSKGTGTIKFTVTAGTGAVGAASFTIAAQ